MAKIFEEIVVEYPPENLCTYPEYRGKPYFSIKYEENGEHFVGFGTYKPERLSLYLKEYFMQPVTMESEVEKQESRETAHWIRWYEKTETDCGTEYDPHCKCSKCGTEYDPHSSIFIHFCLHCGAKLEENHTWNEN